MVLTFEQIKTIISEATPTNTKGAVPCGVSVYKGGVFVFALVQLYVKGLFKLKLKRLQHSFFMRDWDLIFSFSKQIF